VTIVLEPTGGEINEDEGKRNQDTGKQKEMQRIKTNYIEHNDANWKVAGQWIEEGKKPTIYITLDAQDEDCPPDMSLHIHVRKSLVLLK
jgi:hypothetical protein